jgi:hypothetical protein
VPTAAHVLKLLRVEAPRVLRRESARTSVRLAAFAAIALAATWPLLSTADALNDFRDSQYFTLFEEAARLSVAKFHQLPLWNPYYCGGTYLLGTPSARFVSPTFLATLIFGVERADALIAFAMSVLGMEGVWRYAHGRGAAAHAALLAAPAFALSGLFAHNPPLGWANFYSFELLPWVAFGLHRAVRGSVRGAVVAGLAVTWMIGHGGTYPAPMTLFVGVVEVLGWLAARRRWRRPTAVAAALGMAALAATLAAAGSMVRLWPVAQVLASGPRLLGSTEAHDLLAIGRMLFNGAYLVGAVALPVVLVGFVRRSARALAIAAVLVVWLAMGYGAHPSAFELLRKIPPYTMLRAPERFLALVAFYYAVLGALGATEVEALARVHGRAIPEPAAPGTAGATPARPHRALARMAARVARWLAPVATALLVGNLVPLIVDYHWRIGERTLMAPPSEIAGDFRQARGNRWLAAFYPAIGRGTVSCFDDYDIPQSAALREDLAAEEYLKDTSAGTVARVAWSPNRIDLHAELTHPARLLVNQNWHPGWRANVGTVVDDDGRIAVDLPAGSHELTLRFMPRSAVGGLGATLLTLVACALLWRRWRGSTGPQTPRAWVSTWALAAGPFLCPLATLALLREPPRPPPNLVTPAGDPIVAEAPPSGATPLHVQLEDGVTVEGVTAQLVGRLHEQTLALEIDWRLSSKVERGLGVFIHVEADGMDSLNIDHVRISGVALFDDLPAGATLRDVIPPIAIPAPKKPTTLHVYVGVWRARGDASRLRVIDPAAAKIDDNRVLVASFNIS